MTGQEIAVIGMAGRFPGARSIEEYWRNLREGVESVQLLSADDLLARGVPDADLADPAYVRAAAMLDGVDQFDAGFFGFSPKDAAIMDPQHRHFLECAWEALENAGHNPAYFRGAIGVYAGSGMNAYLIHNLLKNRKLVQSAGMFLLRQTGNDKDVLATRASYQLNLRGPSINVQTACSTSLVAIHMACQSLLSHECDMALAGGVTIEIPHGVGYLYREGEILAQDGHCRSFDARSTGTVFGSGVGLVVLRRLRDAIENGDHIRAVVLGSAVNNDGSRKVGYLAPSVEGQAEVIAEALAVAGVDATSVSYVETHGTGTKVGDPIEISGLTQAFREFTGENRFCAIGSVKSNIGHLDTAAGAAGFIKTVLALEHGQIPASLHFEKPNPHIDFANSPFYVNAQLQEWKSNGVPRRAGVTSLGIGGTNAHVILEEAPTVERPRGHRPWQLLTLSARSAAALDAASAALATHWEEHPELDIADVSFTGQLGRKAFKHRRALVCRSAREAIDGLRGADNRHSAMAGAGSGDREVVFLFPGQGSQYVNMGLELYRNEPEFRRWIDQCSELLQPHLGLDLRTVLYPPDQEVEERQGQLTRTWLTQPALFTIEYALAKLWMSWGIRPAAMVGHSIGEYVAACVAGVFSLDAALAIVAARGRLMQGLPPGAMTGVPLSESEMLPLIGGDIALAAINGTQQCVASGPVEAIEKFEQDLGRRDVSCRRLNTSHAFHSPMTEPILGQFAEVVSRFPRQAPHIPYLSNVTGDWISPAAAEDPEYWAKQLRGTVRFADALDELFRAPGRILLEVGPGQTLSALARQHPRKVKEQRVFQSMRHPKDPASDVQVLLTTLGSLWSAGTNVNWEAFRAHDRGYRVPLPTYPFERQRYWIEPEERDPGVVRHATPLQSALAQWFYRPTWKQAQSPLPAEHAAASLHWLILTDDDLGPVVAKQLRSAGHTVTCVTAGHRFSAGGDKYALRPGDPEDYRTLVADLVAKNRAPSRIVHLWALNAASGPEGLEDSQNASFYSLLFLAQALGAQDLTDLQVTVVSDRMQRVGDEPSLHPETATLLGPCLVIPEEYPGILCRSLDVSLAKRDHARVARQVIDEAIAAPPEPVVARRGDDRRVQTFEPVTIEASTGNPRLRERGVYLITGGLGGIGLTIAERLAKEVHARLILTSRTQLPPRDEWEMWLGAHGAEPLAHTIRKIQQLEDAGAEVQIACADVANREQMRSAIDAARQRFGAIHGAIHAAGVLDDGLIQFKTKERAAAVLEPKLKGTFVLDELLKDSGLDFLALFSSISSIRPPAGQVDYAAANAFLDAFARSKPPDSHTLTTVINWARWREVGMGARDRTGAQGPASFHGHPLLDARTADPSGGVVYSGKLNCEAHWILDQHRLRDGKAVFPGTGYLSMAAAALTEGAPDRPIELRDVLFVAPFAFDPRETREVRLRARGGPVDGQFSVAAGNRETGKWEEYCSGTWGRPEPAAPAALSPAQLIARCNLREAVFPDGRTRQERYFTFGPRWRSLQRIHIGEGEGVSVLELPAEFHGDLEEYSVHPALFDIATGSALYLIRDYESSDDMYLPLGYRKVTIWGRLPARIYSHIRVTGDNSGGEVSTFDVLIMDEAGAPMIVIEGFALRRIGDKRLPTARSNPRATNRQSASEAAWERDAQGGISPSEGGEAFLRILSKTNIGPAVVVSPQDPDLLLKQAGAGKPTAENASQAGRSGSAPESESAPPGQVEQTLIGWWNELLGAEQVSVDDDFFDLGGHSLVAAQLFARIRKTYRVELDLPLLFTARTIARLAAVVRKELKQRNGRAPALPRRWTSLVPIQSSGDLPPIYFVSGAGGHVLIFQSLSNYLGPRQPVYALQPQGLDGKQSFLTTMEDIASYYLREIRTVQPSGPYHLAGYSFGGIVTFEMAQQLRANGEEVGMLALLDAKLRFWERVKSSSSLTTRLKHYGSRVKESLGRPDGLAHVWERVRVNIWDNTLIRSHQELLRAFRAIGRPMPRAIGDIEDANWFAAANYKPKVYPGPLVLVRCSETSAADRDDDLLGWRDLAASIDVKITPGDHFTLVKEPYVGKLAETLRLCMSEALARTHESAQASVGT